MLRDTHGAVPMTAPMMIWEDEVSLDWSDEEREALEEMGGFEATLAKPQRPACAKPSTRSPAEAATTFRVTHKARTLGIDATA